MTNTREEVVTAVENTLVDFKNNHYAALDEKADRDYVDGLIAEIRGEAEKHALFPGGGKQATSGRYGFAAPEWANPIPSFTNPTKAETEAWSSYLTTGEIRADMQVGNDPKGGIWVQPHTSSLISSVAFETSPIRSIARIETISTGDAWEEPLLRDTPETRWIGETQSRPVTATTDISMFRVPLHEIEAVPKFTAKLLETSGFRIETWHQRQVNEMFGRQENTAFVSGDGNLKPRGFLTYDATAQDDATRPWGTVEYLPTGVSGAFPAADADTADLLEDMVTSMKAEYRANAVWLGNRATFGVLRKLRDADGRALWDRPMTAGQPASLLGFPVVEAEDMPSIAADSFSLAFCNLKRSYLILDFSRIRIIRDEVTDRPWIKLPSYKRVGGGLYNFECVKLLKFSVS